MGSIYEFHCEGCDYEFESSDGEDCGFTAHIHSIFCEDCQQVMSVLIYMPWVVRQRLKRSSYRQ
jgi:hypothetical protein